MLSENTKWNWRIDAQSGLDGDALSLKGQILKLGMSLDLQMANVMKSAFVQLRLVHQLQLFLRFLDLVKLPTP